MTRRSAIVALAAGFAVVLGACGVPLDDSPHPITQATITADDTSTTTTTVAPSGSQEVSVYFLNDHRLERKGFGVTDEPTIREALQFVLLPPPEGMDTAIPPGIELRNVDVTDGTATIDLTGEINDVRGTPQKEAFAQIVFTALAIEGVQQVRFLIDGQPIQAPTDDGNVDVVTADNYDKPLNPR